MTDAALANLSLDDLLRELLHRMTDILHTDTAAFLLLDEDANELVARAAKGIEEEVEQGVRIPVGRGFAGRIAAERRAVTIADVDHADILNPILRERGIRSLLGVPLFVEGRVLGVLHVGTLTPRTFTSEDAETSREVIRRDKQIDECYRRVFDELIEKMIDEPTSTTGAAHLLFVAKHLERIGDYVKDICELNVYLREAVFIKHSAKNQV